MGGKDGYQSPAWVEFEDEPVTREIIGASIDVHRALGPGLLESAYQVCLARAIAKRGLGVVREVPVPVVFEGESLDCGYRLDLLVEDQVIVETKSVDAVLPVHEAQLLTYPRLTKKIRGLFINFNVPLLKQGLHRKILSEAAR
jgi:GxxExxY protein